MLDFFNEMPPAILILDALLVLAFILLALKRRKKD
ncbi:MAG: LPXTG cell wall anchor domain-containing protein [Patescibacteria group bacterium]